MANQITRTMKQQCNCGNEQAERPIATVSGAHLAQLAALSGQSLLNSTKSTSIKARYTPGALEQESAGGIQTHFHLTEAGDALATTSFADGNNGEVVLRGTIAGLPYEMHLRVAFEGEKIAVTLHLTKPIEIGPYTWHFDLGGVVKDSAGKIVSAASITPSAEAQAMGINWWCAVKCGGATILPTLVLCLPAFSGGPAAYIACVTGKMGTSSAAAIAACIAKNCL